MPLALAVYACSSVQLVDLLHSGYIGHSVQHDIAEVYLLAFYHLAQVCLDSLSAGWRRWGRNLDDKEVCGFRRYAKPAEGFSYLF